tara:strand:+ start:12899 stop:14017 length:1119 start_codon:yes stop_codon:yes gene_type:complete
LYKKILITGSNGFIAKNLYVNLIKKHPDIEVLKFSRENNLKELQDMVKDVDLIYHLAGENRPKDKDSFYKVNQLLTKKICEILSEHDKNVPIIFSSTTKVTDNNDYGKSKLAAEKLLEDFSSRNKNKVLIYRLPNVFGKWCKPNYNSVVATYCHNIIRDIEIRIDNPDSDLNLIYIDDLVDIFLSLLDENNKSDFTINNVDSYKTTVGKLAEDIQSIHKDRLQCQVQDVGVGFKRALYSTYLSYLDKGNFMYDLKSNIDERGNFVEMLKTESSGQISFFTALPGITRGGHFHNTKNEKFLIISGKAKFRFKNLLDDEFFELEVNSDNPQIVETIPGWAHDITNIGETNLLVMLWSNEIFDEKNPDTYLEVIK